MGVASLILGIISAILGLIPGCNFFILIPAVVGLILGIVEIVKKNKAGEPKGMGIAGTILSALAIIVIIFWVFVFGQAMQLVIDEMEASNLTVNEFVEALNGLDVNGITIEYENL